MKASLNMASPAPVSACLHSRGGSQSLNWAKQIKGELREVGGRLWERTGDTSWESCRISGLSVQGGRNQSSLQPGCYFPLLCSFKGKTEDASGLEQLARGPGVKHVPPTRGTQG